MGKCSTFSNEHPSAYLTAHVFKLSGAVLKKCSPPKVARSKIQKWVFSFLLEQSEHDCFSGFHHLSVSIFFNRIILMYYVCCWGKKCWLKRKFCCNWIQTQNHLFCKKTLHHLAIQVVLLATIYAPVLTMSTITQFKTLI